MDESGNRQGRRRAPQFGSMPMTKSGTYKRKRRAPMPYLAFLAALDAEAGKPKSNHNRI